MKNREDTAGSGDDQLDKPAAAADSDLLSTIEKFQSDMESYIEDQRTLLDENIKQMFSSMRLEYVMKFIELDQKIGWIANAFRKDGKRIGKDCSNDD